jgi:predicted regulator of Ras-like GTPase activity (Roadblock/LC7/MglB family)
VDAAQALADLTEISSQIDAAVLFDASGEVEASTLAGDDAARAFARGAAELLERAGSFRSSAAEVTQLEVSTQDGSVFVVRDGAHRIAATTAPEPTVGLVFYDLKSCLRNATAEPEVPEVPEEPEQPKRSRRKKEPDGAT